MRQDPDNLSAAEVTSKSFNRLSLSLFLPPPLLFDSVAHLLSLRRLPAPRSRQVVSDKESSMEEQGVQNLNLPQGPCEPRAVLECISFGDGTDTSNLGHPESQLPNLSSCTYFHPLCNQVCI